MLKSASEKYNWDLDLLAVARTLQINSNIRSRSLNRVIEAFDRNNKLINLFNDSYFRRCAYDYSESMRTILATAISGGIPVPAFTAALEYIDSYRSSRLATGIIQLTNDYIDETGYERVDVQGVFRANWNSHMREITQTISGS